VLVALGTIVVLKQQQVETMAAAFASMPHVCFVWSLKEVSRSLHCAAAEWLVSTTACDRNRIWLSV
jgi:hypothetical protein